MKTLKQNIPLIANPHEYIANATDVFSYIDSDFKSWNTNIGEDTDSEISSCSVSELTENKKFSDIFTDPEHMYLSQKQVIDFCRNHKDQLSENYTFFLFKVGTELFVASVYVRSGGGLGVDVNRLSDGRVWSAERRHRVVFPQLTPHPLDSDSLTPRSSDTVESKLDRIIELLVEIRDNQ